MNAKTQKPKKPISDKIYSITCFAIMFIFVIFTIMPIINVFATSLSSYKDTHVMFFPKMFDIFAIKYVLTAASFYNAFFTTIRVVVFGVLISVLCMTMLGYALSKKNLPFRRTVFMIFLIAMLFSGGMVPNYILMSSLRLTDTIFSLIFPSVVMVFHMILMKTYFEGLESSIEESAKLDGASNFTVFFRIILPISMPMIVTVTLFTAVVYWNNYSNALLYISSRAKNLYPLPYYLIQLNAQFADPNASQVMGDAFFYKENIRAAVIILSILPIALAYPFFLKFFTKGITVGAEK